MISPAMLSLDSNVGLLKLPNNRITGYLDLEGIFLTMSSPTRIRLLAALSGCLYTYFMRPILGFLFAVCLGVSARAEFHVPDREYRCPPSDKTCKSLHNLSSQEQRTTPAGGKFTINYVEYKD